MPRCNAIGADTRGLLDEMVKLDVVVAEDAGTRRLSPKICFDERSDHGVLKVLLEIQNVVRNSELRRHTPGIPEIVKRTASSVVSPQLHGETDDLFTGFL